jgi:hypothetical protein
MGSAGIGGHSGPAARIPLIFTGDPAGTYRCQRVPRPSDKRHFSVYIGWLATGSPAGAVTPKGYGSSAASETGETLDGVSPLTVAASGTRTWTIRAMPVDDPYVDLVYVATSGTVTFTDNTGSGTPFGVWS